MSAAAAGRSGRKAGRNATGEGLPDTERLSPRLDGPTPAEVRGARTGTPDPGLSVPAGVVWKVVRHPAAIALLDAVRAAGRTKAYRSGGAPENHIPTTAAGPEALHGTCADVLAPRGAAEHLAGPDRNRPASRGGPCPRASASRTRALLPYPPRAARIALPATGAPPTGSRRGCPSRSWDRHVRLFVAISDFPVRRSS